MNWISQNTKMKKSGVRWFNWGIPAFKSESGFKTCPGAKDCIKGCYASPGQGFYGYPHVKRIYEARLSLSKTDDFVTVINRELKSKRVEILRVHDSGDFYSARYALDWGIIAIQNPRVQFYSYTKNIPLATSIKWPGNWRMIYSEGGKWDNMIDREKDRHARIFATHEDLLASGYADASENDTPIFGTNHKIGLVYHGSSKRKCFTTGPSHVSKTNSPERSSHP